MSIIKAENINKYFYTPDKFKVINNLTIEAQKGEFLALVGKSGSGKSTLLYILSTMDTDYEGKLTINNKLLTGKTKDELADFRNQHIGFVFQFHYLLPEFTVLENVMLPALKLGKFTKEEIRNQALEKLDLLGVKEQNQKLASKLSGGQQQRVAIARALINNPTIIMADEPTGNLDSVNSDNVLQIFKQLCKENHQTIIAVTHDNDFAKETDRIIELKDGSIL